MFWLIGTYSDIYSSNIACFMCTARVGIISDTKINCELPYEHTMCIVLSCNIIQNSIPGCICACAAKLINIRAWKAGGLLRHEFAIYGYELTIHFHIWWFCDVTDRWPPTICIMWILVVRYFTDLVDKSSIRRSGYFNLH